MKVWHRFDELPNTQIITPDKHLLRVRASPIRRRHRPLRFAVAQPRQTRNAGAREAGLHTTLCRETVLVGGVRYETSVELEEEGRRKKEGGRRKEEEGRRKEYGEKRDKCMSM